MLDKSELSPAADYSELEGVQTRPGTVLYTPQVLLVLSSIGNLELHTILLAASGRPSQIVSPSSPPGRKLYAKMQVG